MPRMTPAIVFYALDTAATRRFYETLGFDFAEERHGEGPVHYSCDFLGMVLEIYPHRAGITIKPCDSVSAFFPVENFDATVAGLKALGMKPGTVSVYIEARNLRAVSVRDPDGRLVRLLENDPRDVQ